VCSLDVYGGADDGMQLEVMVVLPCSACLQQLTFLVSPCAHPWGTQSMVAGLDTYIFDIIVAFICTGGTGLHRLSAHV